MLASQWAVNTQVLTCESERKEDKRPDSVTSKRSHTKGKTPGYPFAHQPLMEYVKRNLELIKANPGKRRCYLA
jgi:hypothetical protein